VTVAVLWHRPDHGPDQWLLRCGDCLYEWVDAVVIEGGRKLVPDCWNCERLQAQREAFMDAEGPPLNGFAQPMTVRGIDVPSAVQRWLWTGRLPLGELVIPAGPEKLGKSTAMLWVAARVTRGELPGDLYGQPADVAYISAEDNASRVLVPRLSAAGADLKRVWLMNPHPDGELFATERLAELDDLKLVVLDPLSVFLDLLPTSEHGEVAVRKSLRPFVTLAQDKALTAAGVRHLNKGAGAGNPWDAIMGSRAFSAAARSVLFFTKDPERPEGLGGLIYARGNLAAPAPPQRYVLRVVDVALDDGNVGQVPLYEADDSLVTMSLEEAMGPQGEPDALDEAVDWLHAVLGLGRVEAKRVERLARDAGLSMTTVRRARKLAGVVSEREGFGPGGKWYWALSIDAQSTEEPMHLCESVSVYDDSDDLEPL